MVSEAGIQGWLREARYADLAAFAAEAGAERLAGLWAGLKPMERLVLFKLLEPSRALEFYRGLAFEEKYFLLCGFPLAAIAPVLERAGGFFKPHPSWLYERMCRLIVTESRMAAVAVAGRAQALPPLRGGGIRRGGDIAVNHCPPPAGLSKSTGGQ